MDNRFICIGVLLCFEYKNQCLAESGFNRSSKLMKTVTGKNQITAVLAFQINKMRNKKIPVDFQVFVSLLWLDYQDIWHVLDC